MLEADFSPHVEKAINSPQRQTRFERINAGRFEVVDRKRKTTRWVKGARKGVPDFVGFARGGVHIELELKGPKTKVPPHQLARERFVRKMGCVYVRYRYDTNRSLEANVQACLDEVDCAVDEHIRGPVCVTPNGRTDGHLVYTERGATGGLVCAFCGRDDGLIGKQPPRRCV